MLLFVLDAELDQRQRLGGEPGQRTIHRLVDMRAPVAHLVEARPADHAPLWPRMAFALPVVIAVEQEGEAIVERAVMRHMIAQHERLEKPVGVGQVPFGGRGVGKRLDRRIGIRQRRGEVERQRARRGQPPGEAGAYCSRVAPGRHSTSPPSPAATERAATNKWSDSRLR